MNAKLLTAVLFLTLATQAYAANDPKIKGDIRSNVQYSMQQFIDSNSVDGKLFLYDSNQGKLLKLKLDELHSGIVKKGDFYVSCADFKDQNGRKIDVDFLVVKNGNQLITTQGIVHSVNGKKRKYHLEKI